MRASLAVLLLLCAPPALAGSQVRYALVVGSNRGVFGSTELEPLQHAERDAAALAARLKELGNFEPDRVELVVGRGRQAILDAAARLAARHQRDRAELGELPTLFAFFFTGHGLSGQLLTADAPLDGKDLAGLFTRMDARLTLAFVDACYAASMDLAALKAKGAKATPGFNPITELPKEILDSEGTMWFASSQESELSYEDAALGGLFTHFLLEGFTQAPRDGVGVSLENLWEYARQRTSTFAARQGRSQNPERIVRHLKSRSPLYLSFPAERDAALLFEPEVEGRFLLHYEQAALVERITKQAGRPLAVAAYPGDVVLRRMGSGEALPGQRLTLARGTSVRVRPEGAGPARRALGFTEVPIRRKGGLTELTFSEQRSASVLALGAAARASASSPGLLGAPWSYGLGLLFARGRLSLSLSAAFGQDEARYADWSHRTRQLSADLFFGYGLELSALRLDLEAGGGPRLWSVVYGDGAERAPLGGWLGGGLRAQLPLFGPRPWAVLHARAGLGALFAPGLAASERRLYASPAVHLEAGLSVPLPLD